MSNVRPYFTYREKLYGIVAFIWVSLWFWLLALSNKTIDDVLVNLITDIGFAFFVVVFIEHATEKDRRQRNRARDRAVALAIQRFYQQTNHVILALIQDGISSSVLTDLPSSDAIRERAKKFRSTTLLRTNFSQQPNLAHSS